MNPFGCGPNPCKWPCRPRGVLDCGICLPGTTRRTMLVTIPIMGNASCLNCADYAGTYELIQQANPCVWRLDNLTPHPCGPNPAFDIQLFIGSAAISLDLVFGANAPGWQLTPLPVMDCSAFQDLELPPLQFAPLACDNTLPALLTSGP